MSPGNGDARTIEIERPGPGSHRTTLIVEGAPIDTLADLPPLRNRLLFVGLQPSVASVEAGHYHPEASGTLWAWLVVARILPPGSAGGEADDALVAAGHGITDLLKTPAGDVRATDRELTAGVGRLWQKVAVWRPGAVVFLDRRAASIAASRAIDEPWGQLAGVALSGRPCFLIPAPDAPADVLDEALNFLRNLAASMPD